MTAFERYVSEIVENESPIGVDQKYSDSLGQYAVVQVLQPWPSMDIQVELLFLRACETDSSEGLPIYNRFGRATIESLHPRNIITPSLIQKFRLSEIRKGRFWTIRAEIHAG